MPRLILCLFGSLICCGAVNSIDSQQWDANAQLWGARTCYAEAAWSEADCTPILWVISKRFRRVEGRRYRDRGRHNALRPWRWLDMLREYAAVGNPHPRARLSPRQREIRAFPWGDLSEIPPHVTRFSPNAKVERFNENWAILRSHVEAWGRGEFPDPCPRADQWGGRMDAPGQTWKVIDCGETHNTFYDGPG